MTRTKSIDISRQVMYAMALDAVKVAILNSGRRGLIDLVKVNEAMFDEAIMHRLKTESLGEILTSLLGEDVNNAQTN